MYPCSNSIISWHHVEVPRFPAYLGVVYLLHFLQPLGDVSKPHGTAQHYLGSACHLEKRLQQHRNDQAGAKIMQACRERGIDFVVVRLWPVNSWDEQRDKEKRLKARHENNVLCPLCNPRLAPCPHAAQFYGHPTFYLFAKPGRRQPMTTKPMYYLH